MHYGVGVLPARPRKPCDKAKVEVGVQIAERWIVAALRHRKFFSLGELNRAIRELLEKLNQRPFQKREGSRRSLFLEVDQPALRPLPTERFDLSVWSQATVNIDYHIQFDGSFYSVPYQLARQTVEVRATPTTIEIFHQRQRVASHVRARKPFTAVTNSEHRPASHRAHLELFLDEIQVLNHMASCRSGRSTICASVSLVIATQSDGVIASGKRPFRGIVDHDYRILAIDGRVPGADRSVRGVKKK